MYGTLWTIPALRDQDCAPYTIEEAETHFTVSRHYPRTKPPEWWSAPRRWEQWHAPQSWQWRPNGSRKNVSGQPRMSEPWCQAPTESNVVAPKGVGLLRRVRQTDRHVGSNSERWSVHALHRKKQRPALYVGARPRPLWKNGNRAVSVSRKERNLNKHLEGLVRLTDALVQSTLTSSRALS